MYLFHVLECIQNNNPIAKVEDLKTEKYIINIAIVKLHYWKLNKCDSLNIIEDKTISMWHV